MRKTLGAGKNQLFLQFWGESLLVFLGALLLGLLLANLLLEPFQTLFNTRASFKNVISFRNIFGFVAAISFITFIASMMQTTVSAFTFAPTSTNGSASGDGLR